MTRQCSARKAGGSRSRPADGGGRARRLIRGLALGTIALVLVAGCSGGGSAPEPSPTSPGPMALPATFTALPEDLQGTWNRVPQPGLGATSLTLQACDVGQYCGRVYRIDGAGENCFHPLTLTAGTAEEVTFATGPGNTLGCAYSAWSDDVLVLTPVNQRTIQIDLQGPDTAAPVTLTRE